MRTEENKQALSKVTRAAYLFKRNKRKRSVSRTEEKKKNWKGN